MPEMLQATGCRGEQPDAVVACVGGGSNAMGIFYPYINHANTRLIGVEAAGEGMDTDRHSCSLQLGAPGVLHGNRTYILQDANGQITETHSISAGLDYPGVGPEHAWLKDIGYEQHLMDGEDSEKLAASRWANVLDFVDWISRRCGGELRNAYRCQHASDRDRRLAHNGQHAAGDPLTHSRSGCCPGRGCGSCDLAGESRLHPDGRRND